MALVTAILLSVILMSAGRFLFGIFTTDANVVEIGLSMMQIISPTYFCLCLSKYIPAHCARRGM